MKVIVCGAGQVGSSIARQLSAENNDVTVVDQSSKLVSQISDPAIRVAHIGNGEIA